MISTPCTRCNFVQIMHELNVLNDYCKRYMRACVYFEFVEMKRAIKNMLVKNCEDVCAMLQLRNFDA